MKSLVIWGLFLFTCSIGSAQDCTKLGLFAGSFSNPELLELIKKEDPEIIRAFLNDDAISLIADQTETRQFFMDYLDTLKNLDIEVIVTIRFPYECNDGTECNPTQDRIISDTEELNSFMTDARLFLEAAKGKLDYLQVLNEPLGAGRYDSVKAGFGDQAVRAWFDTIFSRFYNLRNEIAPEIELISPSVLVNGIQDVKNGKTELFSYNITIKTFEIANTFCDGISYHWYPETFQQMESLMNYLDTTTMLSLEKDVYEVCTEWSQGHEIRALFQSDQEHWENILTPFCKQPDPGEATNSLGLINDSLGIDHDNIWKMYQLMNERNYRFAAYFSLIQGYIDTTYVENKGCDIRNYWYALASLYATHLTEKGVTNGEIYNAYQDMKDSIQLICSKTGLDPMLLSDPQFKIYPNPAEGNTLFIEIKNPDNSLYHLSIMDLQGRIIRKGTRFRDAAELDIAAIPPGLYVVKIYANGRENISPSFIKLIKR